MCLRDRRNKTVYERREFKRFQLPEGQLSAELGVGSLAPTQTLVRDISLGGVRLDIPTGILDCTVAGNCAVRFLDRSNHVLPATARGIIRRIDEHDGRHSVAIEFAQPLETVGVVAAGAF